VDEHIWRARYCSHTKSYYVETNRGEDIMGLHNFITNHEKVGDSSVDHINHNPLDNRKINLRIVNSHVQMINRRIFSNNTSGTAGVSRNGPGAWLSIWTDENGERHAKSFSVKKYGDEGAKQRAIDFRKLQMESLPNYREALGMPEG